MKIKSFIGILTTLLVMSGCDDSTDTLGNSIIPDSDNISIRTLNYTAGSKSLLANDSILAKTSMVYLGRYTDADMGTMFESNFIAQFNCVEDYGFPDSGVIGDSATSINIQLFYSTYFGDSLNAMKVEVYPLTHTLDEDSTYYTNLDPAQYYDNTQGPLAEKLYSAYDVTMKDSTTSSSYTPHVTIPLPRELGTWFIQKFYETDADGNHIGKEYYANSETFINNICKGFYFKSSQGDGTILYIRLARINVYFDYRTESSTGAVDSVITGVTQFSSTQEVLQVNNFNNNNLQTLVEDTTVTYLKTPAGIFTEVDLPIDEIVEDDDSLNSVKITFTRKNNAVNQTAAYQNGIPQTLLMVRKQDMYSFFDQNRTVDNITSFYTDYNSSYNIYEFSNISRLVTYCKNERNAGIANDSDWKAKNPDWNKVVLIPVTTTTDSNGNIVGFSHDLTMNSTKLQGGSNKIDVKVVVSRYN